MSVKAVVRKRGNRLGFWFFHISARIFGLRGAYGLLYIVCLYYLLFDRAAVSAGMAYVKRRFKEYGAFRRTIAVYKLFISQGKNLIDRYFLISGHGKFDIELQGYDKIKRFADNSEKGFILLTAHVGNWQIAMTTLERFGRTVHLLMLPEENIAVREALAIDIERGKIKIISSQDPLAGVLESMKAIQNGDIVSIMGDRIYGDNAIEAGFLGGRVRLPYGAFSIAVAAGCPVVVLLSAKVSTAKYVVDVSRVIEAGQVSRRDRQEELKRCVQEFASILEDYAAGYPFQWFVFRDIWEKDKNQIKGG